MPAGARPAAAGTFHRRSVDLSALQRGICGALLACARAESRLIPANALA
jgi:hypothetical protein